MGTMPKKISFNVTVFIYPSNNISHLTLEGLEEKAFALTHSIECSGDDQLTAILALLTTHARDDVITWHA